MVILTTVDYNSCTAVVPKTHHASKQTDSFYSIIANYLIVTTQAHVHAKLYYISYQVVFNNSTHNACAAVNTGVAAKRYITILYPCAQSTVKIEAVFVTTLNAQVIKR